MSVLRRAIASPVAWLCLFLALFAVEQARAGDFYGPNNAGYTRENAWAACVAADNGTYYTHCFETTANAPYAGAVCGRPTQNGVFNCWYYNSTPCASGSTWNSTTHTCTTTAPTAAQCLARNVPDPGDTDGRGASNYFYIVGTAPSSTCIAGCTITIDTAFRTFEGINPTTGATVTWGEHERTWSGGTCSTDVPTNQDGNPESSMENPASNATPQTPEWSCDYAHGTCVSPDGDINFCTFTGAGTTASPYVRSACVPAGGDSDADGIPNPQDPYPEDPTNGDAGVEGEHVSGGGGTCASPPTCSGDGILCASLFQGWKARCETEELKDLTKQMVADEKAKSATQAGTSCSIAPTCSGDAIACASYIEQRKTRCAIENGTGSSGSGTTTVTGTVTINDPNRNTQPTWTEVTPGDPSTGAATPGTSTLSYGPGDLDDGGLVSGHSIPPLPTTTLAYFNGMSFMGDSSTADLWEWLILLFRGLIMLSASIACARIFAGLRG